MLENMQIGKIIPVPLHDSRAQVSSQKENDMYERRAAASFCCVLADTHLQIFPWETQSSSFFPVSVDFCHLSASLFSMESREKIASAVR